MATGNRGADALRRAVFEFVERLTPVLAQWPEAKDLDPDNIRRGLVAEARQISAGFVAVDAGSTTASCWSSGACSARTTPSWRTDRSRNCATATS
jgi:hypothetical protein